MPRSSCRACIYGRLEFSENPPNLTLQQVWSRTSSNRATEVVHELQLQGRGRSKPHLVAATSVVWTSRGPPNHTWLQSIALQPSVVWTSSDPPQRHLVAGALRGGGVFRLRNALAEGMGEGSKASISLQRGTLFQEWKTCISLQRGALFHKGHGGSKNKHFATEGCTFTWAILGSSALKPKIQGPRSKAQAISNHHMPSL